MFIEKNFDWTLDEFSTMEDEGSFSIPFEAAGCTWDLRASFLEETNDRYLGVSLELKDFPTGWSREVNFRSTLVNKANRKSNIVSEGRFCFDAKRKRWGFKHFVSCTKLREKGGGFLMNDGDELNILAEIKIHREESVKIGESQSSSKEGNQASESHGNSCCQVEQETETSFEENSDGEDDTSDESTDDDETEESSDDEGVRATCTQTANNMLEEIQPEKEINGFKVSSSQVELVRRIFERHPETALNFRPKNQQIRTTYMNELLSLIQTLCKAPENLSEDDLSKAEDTLCDLTDVGFELEWLKTKLSEVREKKQKEQGIVAKIMIMEALLRKLKLMFSDIETKIRKEKEKTLASRTPLSFNDIV